MKQSVKILIGIAVFLGLFLLYQYYPKYGGGKPPHSQGSPEGFEERTCSSNAQCPRYFLCKEGKCIDPRPKPGQSL